uniref:Uncharacterized protein n=1 Tax=Parastrongyloides trichosuri TaxID=131310 RepID=A0A0N4ZU81_PARTI
MNYVIQFVLLFLLIVFVFSNEDNSTEHNIFLISDHEVSCINRYLISPWSSFEVDVNCIKFCMNRGCTHCCRSRDTPRDINCLEKAGFFLQGTGEYTRL